VQFAKRLSYLIDPQGVIKESYEVGDVAAHPGEILADLRTLSG
jgi:peroxiredoxin